MKPTKLEKMALEINFISTIFQKRPEVADAYKEKDYLFKVFNENLLGSFAKVTSDEDDRLDQCSVTLGYIYERLIIALKNLTNPAKDILPNYLIRDIHNSVGKLHDSLDKFRSTAFKDTSELIEAGKNFVTQYIKLADEIKAFVVKIQKDSLRMDGVKPGTFEEMVKIIRESDSSLVREGITSEEIERSFNSLTAEHKHLRGESVNPPLETLHLHPKKSPKEFKSPPPKLNPDVLVNLPTQRKPDVIEPEPTTLEKAYFASKKHLPRIPAAWPRKVGENTSELDADVKKNMLAIDELLSATFKPSKKDLTDENRMAASRLVFDADKTKKAAALLAKLPKAVRANLENYDNIIDISFIKTALRTSEEFRNARIYGVDYKTKKINVPAEPEMRLRPKK